MFSIATLISRRAREWADAEKQNASSAPGGILRHMDAAGKLRTPQVRAIETYLWLKFCGGNKRLADLVIDGDVVDSELAAEHHCAEKVYKPLQQFLIIFARENELPALEKSVREDLAMQNHEWEKELRALLHDFAYPNHLYSLPMGAGKTYLMAAFIVIDLHFSRLLPRDKRFAQNFIVFAPHAAKTAILPSLKTIRAFDPHWVLPAAGADEVRREMHVEILDAAKSAAKSTRVNNPNLEKVNRLSQTRARGLVFITNAEKVVLERADTHGALYASLGMVDRAKVQTTNELRARMAEIPNLAVFLDEVHHAYQGSGKSEKKLRDAVRVLGEQRNLRGVVGFSGTPFVPGKVTVGGAKLRLKQLQDVVYDFPLAHGIGVFLKTPKVVRRDDVRKDTFVHGALDAFFAEYDRNYAGGTRSKIAFYCPNIAALNEEILPVVRAWYRKNRAGSEREIFWYYTESSKEYPLPANALAEFHNLDSTHSEKRVVLLVAVGKEGWDCRSLTAVALPRYDTSQVFVLQSSCRCLREVHDASAENALVYLGGENYAKLKDQLQKNHNMSVDEFQNGRTNTAPVVVRKPKLGKLRYTQIDSKIVIESSTETADAAGELAAFLRTGFRDFKNAGAHTYSARETSARITKSGELAETVTTGAAVVSGAFPLRNYWDFLIELERALWGAISSAQLQQRHGGALQKIHAGISQDAEWFQNHPQGAEEMCRLLLLTLAACFAVSREYRRETITEQTTIELLQWDAAEPCIAWAGGRFLPKIERTQLSRLHRHKNRIEEELEDDPIDPQDFSFNYAPYRFDSDFERNAIRTMLKQDFLAKFELYYNGMTAAGLQSFQIRTPQGVYTPDFLLLKRAGGGYQRGAENAAIEKILIIETKAEIYYTDDFKAKEGFINGAFRKRNPQFRYFSAIDKTGGNDFTPHLDRLRREVGEWARA